MTSLNYTETLTVVHCVCGMPFGIPESLHAQMNDKGKSVYCPLGHSWHYTENTEEKLRKERQRHQATRDLLAAEERSNIAQRAATKRFQNKVKRVENGVCPHCNRSFQNLRRHMESKHSHD